MSRKALIILGLQALIIIILFWLLVFYGKDEYEAAVGKDEEEIETESLVVTGKDAKEGAATIRLTPASQQQSGITTTALLASTHQTELASYGSVLSLNGLFELRARYVSALAEAAIARTAIPHSLQQWERLNILNRDNKNVSDQAVAEAETTLKANRARLAGAEMLANTARDALKQQWGEALAVADSSLIQGLMQQRLVLLQITLPDYSPTPGKDSQLLVTPIGATSHNIKAQLISNSPSADSTIQGKTYLYSAPAENLRAGMRVSAQLQSSQESLSGVIVPDKAVVWYANKAWVYQKSGEDLFIRKQINTDIEANNNGDNGWFNHGSLKAGDELVVSGAQLLLSEEFKFQITNENDD